MRILTRVMHDYFLKIIYLSLNKKTNMDKFTKVKELLASVEADAEKFYSAGNNAAGTRVRKAMQDLKVLAQEIRAEVTDKKNSVK
jgi:hypothetical protein